MKKGLTELAVVLDRSGSMHAIREDAMGGFNSFLNDQKKLDGKANFTLVLFNHEYQTPYFRLDLQKVPELTEDTYIPTGTTALHDAVGRTIDEIGSKLDKLDEDEKPEQVIIAVLTDGLENSSRDYSGNRIKEMISHQRDKYNWAFMFLSASEEDATQKGSSMGIDPGMTMNYQNTGKGNRHAYSAVSKSISAMRVNLISEEKKEMVDLKSQEEDAEQR